MYLFCARMTNLLYKNIAQVTCTCGSDATSHAIVWSDAKQMMSGQRKYWKKTEYKQQQHEMKQYLCFHAWEKNRCR